MPLSTGHHRLSIGVVCLAVALPAAAVGQDGRGHFLAISDVHLDPFSGGGADAQLLETPAAGWQALFTDDPGDPADFGSDANVALFEAALADAQTRLAAPDFVVFPGDFVVHRLERKVKAAKADATDATVAEAAETISLFVADRLRAAFPDAPILPALGNTDSACGDYRTEPGGGYLAATFPMVRQLVGEARLDPDAEATWLAGGYYAAAHPTLGNTRFVVLNNILWSTKYENRCGTGAAAGDDAPGEAMLAWLEWQLYAASLSGDHIWLVYHIPPGVDAYSTAHSRAQAGTSCAARVVPFWKEPYATRFDALMKRYGGIVTTAFSGHIHRDSWRLFGGASAGDAVAFTNIVPSVSPIYGNAPAYQLFAYDTGSGAILDKTTYAVTNLSAAARGEEIAFAKLYAFADAYDVSPLGIAALAEVTDALREGSPSADRILYDRYFGSGHGSDPQKDWTIYACTPATATVDAFVACACPAD